LHTNKRKELEQLTREPINLKDLNLGTAMRASNRLQRHFPLKRCESSSAHACSKTEDCLWRQWNRSYCLVIFNMLFTYIKSKYLRSLLTKTCHRISENIVHIKNNSG
jgi:hypothetical protein